MSGLTDKWCLSGNLGIGTSEPYTKLHIVNEISSPHAADGEGGYGNPMVWGKHIELAATEMWGLKKAYGILHTWHSDSLFIGLKDEDEDEDKDEKKGRKDAVIAFGDDANDCLRFLFTSSAGNPLPKPKELLKITSEGNVGIGTASPAEKLHIDSGDYTAGKLLISGTGKWDPSHPNPPDPPHQDQHFNFAELNLWDRVNDRLWHITHRNEPWARNQNKLIFYFGNKVLSGVSPPPTPFKSVMSLIPIIDDDNGSVIGGNVGIGTDEVINNARLSVDGGAIVIGPSKSLLKKADAALQIFSSYGEFDRLLQISPGITPVPKPGLNLVASCDASVEQWWSWGVTVEGAWRINAGTQFDTNNPSGLTIISSGNVGIGTTTPQARLHIEGNTWISGGLRVYGGDEPLTVSKGDYYFFVGVNRSGGDYVDIGAHHGRQGWKNLVLNRDGGNVGIGTPTPETRLHIVGDTKISGNLIVDGALITVHPIAKKVAVEILKKHKNGTAILGSAGGVDEKRLDFYYKFKDKVYMLKLLNGEEIGDAIEESRPQPGPNPNQDPEQPEGPQEPQPGPGQEPF